MSNKESDKKEKPKESTFEEIRKRIDETITSKTTHVVNSANLEKLKEMQNNISKENKNNQSK